MPNQVRIDGDWPSPVRLSRGWARATARPWNDETPDGFLRLERGGYDFLSASTETIARLTDAAVYSPALYPSSIRIWIRSGYEPVDELEVMERSVALPSSSPRIPIAERAAPDWSRIMEIDKAAFEGFWRMSLDGLHEALASTKRSAVLVAEDGGETVGYALVGAQWDVAYLQRIAVHPDRSGLSIGSDLVRASLGWGRKMQSRVMVLNVRKENERAQRLYAKEGFTPTSTSLRMLRYGT